ncbi:ABC transporter substrate-binding protein [Nordella sp. HKS 07]|uniref:heme/hemin ABC transporter substrate-binding protein n=1 Tax=Nordella sp. HKS 07 TaxID=2712222 RepID=UPI0013E18E02|nr:ABC transporter substrate-binding protein [Nordella sp. HKS 07]QIG48517.1 ABC transporter substrate-binding protein [Nordella sp. HKS 07]
MRSVSRRRLLSAGAAAVFTLSASAPLIARNVKDAAGDDVTLGKLDRILSIGGDVTEIIHELGEGRRVIATDTTSTFPPAVLALPKVGYMRALSTEGVLAQSPDLILASAGSGPPEVVAALKQSGVPIALVDYNPTAEAIGRKIALIAEILDVKEKGTSLTRSIEAELAALKAALGHAPRPRTLFVLSLIGGRIMAAGAKSSANEIITLAGGTNAVADFNGFKPASAEAIIAAQPEAVVMMEREGDIGADELFAQEPFSKIPAARTRKLIRMDGSYLLGFGPRTPSAARELAKALHPGLAL